jgi:phosphoglycerate dehydrogenase-like enzyme
MKVKVSTLAFSNNQYLVDLLLKDFPNAVFNSAGKRMQGETLVEYFKDAEGAIVGLEQITGDILDQLPSLKIIAKYGVGLDNIDVEACKARNVAIGWTGGVNKRSVAEMALGFMLALSRNLYKTSNQLKELVWNKAGGFQLTGKTIGIIGLGNIGGELVQLLAPFQCRILVNDIADISSFAAAHDLKVVSKDQLLAESDIISVHTPLNSSTKNLFNREAFKKMKSGAYLINTARGGIVNEYDLKEALKENSIAGAALDVFDPEPPVDQELLSYPNLICTPHTGGNAYEAVVAMGVSAITHLKNYRDKEFIPKP